MPDSGAAWPQGDPDAELQALGEAARRLTGASVLVVGDVMLDRFVHGDVARVSPEAPVPVLSVGAEEMFLGGAGNVVRQLGGLGAAVALVAVVGDDQTGSDLTGLIGGQPGVEPWLLVQGGRVTTLKTRMLARGQQLLRLDREDTSPLPPRLADRMLRIARDAMAATSVTVLSDYRKGVLRGDCAHRLIAAAREVGRPVLADQRGGDLGRYAGADVLLTGERDLDVRAGASAEEMAAAVAAAREANGLGALGVCRGDGGLLLGLPEGTVRFRCTAEAWPRARDAVIATLAVALANHVPVRLGAQLAVLAAEGLGPKPGAVIARPAEMVAALTRRAQASRKLAPPAGAAEQARRWRSDGAAIGLAFGHFDPLRPGHLHLLAQARARCDRLIVALLDAAGPAEPPETAGEGRALRLAALPEVDMVTFGRNVPGADGSGTSNGAALLRLLRPDVLVSGTADPAELAPVMAIAHEWGGTVVHADRLPEPA